jgi:hypothetical protein
MRNLVLVRWLGPPLLPAAARGCASRRGGLLSGDGPLARRTSRGAEDERLGAPLGPRRGVNPSVAAASTYASSSCGGRLDESKRLLLVLDLVAAQTTPSPPS